MPYASINKIIIISIISTDVRQTAASAALIRTHVIVSK